MNQLTLTLIRVAFLAVLWLFVIAAIGVVRTDLAGNVAAKVRRGRVPRPQTQPQRRLQQPTLSPRSAHGSRRQPRMLAITSGPLAGTTLGLADQQITLGRANDALTQQKWTEAMTLASRCAREYGFFEDIKEQTTAITNMAMAALTREKRQKKEVAMQYKEQADLLFAKGEAHVEAMRSRDVDSSTIRVVSDKQRAIENFSLAIDYYEKALSLYPEMDTVLRQEIQTRKSQAERYHKVLTSKKPLPLPPTPHSLGR